MIHPKLKASKRIKTNFNVADLKDNINVPKESVDFANEYLNSDKLAEDYGYDLMLGFEKEFIFAFDYLYNGKKLAIPEINPVLIFYSNATMSFKMLSNFKKTLLSKSPEIGNTNKSIKPSDFGNFFQLATNCIINLQATVETFLNYSIPEDYEIISKKEKIIRRPSIHDKIDNAIVNINGRNFQDEFQSDYKIIKDLIELRNDIIHLKPIQEETNTKYKELFRRVLGFKYFEVVLAVKKYVNFYESDLIEDCSCGRQLYYDIKSKRI